MTDDVKQKTIFFYFCHENDMEIVLTILQKAGNKMLVLIDLCLFSKAG